MFNNFFTPEQISPRKKSAFRLNYVQKYDFSSLLQKDLFKMVSPHVQSIMDQKRKIISWLKKIPLFQRMNALTYTNKEFVCLIRAMYQKKQSQYQDESSTTFTISHIQQTDEFDLMSMTNNKKLSKQYLAAEDDFLANIRVMSRYTQFDSVTFSQNFIRNVDPIFKYFDLLGDGISRQVSESDYHRLKRLPNSVMFYDPMEGHCFKKTTVFMSHISMKYLQSQLQPHIQPHNQLKQRSKQFQKLWKTMTPESKNQIIKKVLLMKTIDLYQQHRLMIKVTRNGFPLIQKTDKVPSLIGSILNASEKQIFHILLYTPLNQTLQSHSVLKFYVALEIQQQIKNYDQSQINQAKMKKKIKKMKNLSNNQSSKDCKQQNLNILLDKNRQKLQDQVQPKTINHIVSIIKDNRSVSKGTDLFNKKLEISQTHQIISFQSNHHLKIQTKLKVTNKLETQLKVITDKLGPSKPDSHHKKKKKKKNKQDQNQLGGSSQDVLQKTELRQEVKTQIIKQIDQQQNACDKSHNIEMKSQIKVPIHVVRNSQKSSQTTNDNIDCSQEQGCGQKNPQKREQPKPVLPQNKFMEDPLVQILKQTQGKMAFYNKQRKIVINRLSYIFAQHELSFKLYGSTCCGLALPSSDIDIAVDPSIVNYFYFSYSNYRNKIVNSLEYLEKVFERFQWVQDFVLLPGATIPLLTFSVKPGLPFQYQQGNNQYNNKKQLKEQVRISVDVTIQPYINMTDEVPMHLGLQSTQLLQEWVSTFPFYTQIMLLLKILTKNYSLNKMYHGGISSFMQAVILAGFYRNLFAKLEIPLNQFQTKSNKLQEILPLTYNLSKTFKEYCLFILRFEPNQQVIDLNSSRGILPKAQTMSKQQLAIVNPLTGKMMSERCTTFSQYKKLLQKLVQILNSDNQSNIRGQLKLIFYV